MDAVGPSAFAQRNPSPEFINFLLKLTIKHLGAGMVSVEVWSEEIMNFHNNDVSALAIFDDISASLVSWVQKGQRSVRFC